MAFNAYTFTFDGIPCEEYGLMLYDFDTGPQSTGAFASTVRISEDRISRRHTPLHYGATQHTPLEFTLTFGASPEAIDSGQYLDRWDLEVIGAWLTGHWDYKWLTIGQPDMENLRYRCIISGLSFTTVSWLPWALTANALCDGPYAYSYPETHRFTVSGRETVHLLNRSTSNGLYYPKVTLRLPQVEAGQTALRSFSIANETEGGRAFTMTDIPYGGAVTIEIDGENGVLLNSAGLNFYPFCNFQFPRLKRGDNFLTLSGRGEVTFTCAFPINAGG